MDIMLALFQMLTDAKHETEVDVKEMNLHPTYVAEYTVWAYNIVAIGRCFFLEILIPSVPV